MKTTKKSEAEQIKEIKQAATIKVKTLAIALAWVITIIAGIIGGWTLKSFSDSNFESSVERAVEMRTKILVEDLKAQK